MFDQVLEEFGLTEGHLVLLFVPGQDQLVSPTGDDQSPLSIQVPEVTGSVRTDATLKEALSMMLEAGETSLEAVSPAGRRIGKLTLEDLLESAAGTEAS